jgi:DNA ligase (NAD+)
MDKVNILIEKIKSAREAYYNLEPTMSDQEYDALLGELKSLEPTHKETTFVGAKVPDNTPWAKASHEIPMGSLNKINSKDEWIGWANKFGSSEYHMSYKLDGSSMELIYENGLLKQCITRGDGSVGEDVTRNISRVINIPKQIDHKGKICIRGEILMPKEIFKIKYSSEYANPRNTSAGIVRDFKAVASDKITDLKFIAYYGHPTESDTFESMFKELENYGFEIPKLNYVATSKDIINQFDLVNRTRNELEFEIDGCVITLNNIKEFEKHGYVSMRPEASIAWKFDAAMAVSTVRDVRWTVGPTGRITPVAIIEPVNIGGVTITNVSLQNYGIFKELKLSENCRVLVSRRNDVIPYLHSNLDLT